jgi:beta-glucosidase
VTAQLRFPSSFLFGTATSATQIEGGCTTSDWYSFAKEPGRIEGGGGPETACDSWHRWREDIALQASLGMNAYRFSIEWARIEPTPDAIDRAALDEYRRMLAALRDAHIEPMVTLHHFTLPAWLADRGGIVSEGFALRFARFARIAAEALGDLNRLWITINEPNILAAQSYLLGVWPPAKKSPILAMRAQRRLYEAHDSGYHAVKDARPDAAVGVAHHLRVVQPQRPIWRDRLAALTLRRVFNDPFAEWVCRAGTHDFFGINYYSRDVVRFSPRHAGEMFVRRGVPEGAEVSDLGWEVYPEGLGEILRTWARRSRVPVYVTENGIADAADRRRGSFLERHLTEVARAIADGVDVRGYFHWSLLDNFEWADGYAPRFGLAEVDYATQSRRIRRSARVYSRIATERTVEPRPAETTADA